ncbi:hypothetical protein [uncultured Pseudokineococcus sp.]|uniref:hypothetical protein n=1 Tax=uncultured Pseudokineococcus sp. TaxID=1642928 RepID=UPI00262DA463|nr:hypothetical protein [uncultured Pseudokineococcus sp.]
MIKRSVLGVDRLAAFVAGLLLLALGTALVLWWGGWLVRLWPQAPDELTLRTATDAFAAPWWAGASLVAGVVLGLLALWWLLAHRPHRSTGPVRLQGSDGSGGLLLEGSAAVSTAADVLEDAHGVRSARGRLVRDRGELVAEVSAVVEPTADLERVASAAEEVLTDLAVVLGRPDIRGRVRLAVARDVRREARVQ